jgi:hypothetical protein
LSLATKVTSPNAIDTRRAADRTNRISNTKLPQEEVGNLVSQMQSESKVVDFIAAKE